VEKIQLALIILGSIALLESLLILIFPHWAQKLTFKLSKNPTTLEKIGVIEFIIALLLILWAALS
jgi:uncharacterized protein YjeT (DUF2065 family)